VADNAAGNLIHYPVTISQQIRRHALAA